MAAQRSCILPAADSLTTAPHELNNQLSRDNVVADNASLDSGGGDRLCALVLSVLEFRASAALSEFEM